MSKFEAKPGVFSSQYVLDTDHIYQYGLETFGEVQAQKYEELIDKIAADLNLSYWMYPECRHLPTKNHIYRNIILESHLIIYRIKTDMIEVLRVIHSPATARLYPWLPHDCIVWLYFIKCCFRYKNSHTIQSCSSFWNLCVFVQHLCGVVEIQESDTENTEITKLMVNG